MLQNKVRGASNRSHSNFYLTSVIVVLIQKYKHIKTKYERLFDFDKPLLSIVSSNLYYVRENENSLIKGQTSIRCVHCLSETPINYIRVSTML